MNFFKVKKEKKKKMWDIYNFIYFCIYLIELNLSAVKNNIKIDLYDIQSGNEAWQEWGNIHFDCKNVLIQNL